jgi:hypothetical protein
LAESASLKIQQIDCAPTNVLMRQATTRAPERERKMLMLAERLEQEQAARGELRGTNTTEKRTS